MQQGSDDLDTSRMTKIRKRDGKRKRKQQPRGANDEESKEEGQIQADSRGVVDGGVDSDQVEEDVDMYDIKDSELAEIANKSKEEADEESLEDDHSQEEYQQLVGGRGLPDGDELNVNVELAYGYWGVKSTAKSMKRLERMAADLTKDKPRKQAFDLSAPADL